MTALSSPRRSLSVAKAHVTPTPKTGAPNSDRLAASRNAAVAIAIAMSVLALGMPPMPASSGSTGSTRSARLSWLYGIRTPRTVRDAPATLKSQVGACIPPPVTYITSLVGVAWICSTRGVRFSRVILAILAPVRTLRRKPVVPGPCLRFDVVRVYPSSLYAVVRISRPTDRPEYRIQPLPVPNF